MSTQSKKNLYQQVIHVTHVYLGPAAERFITRQAESHLHKSPEQITKKDLEMLIDWIKVAVSLLSDDSELIEEYIIQLHKLTDDKSSQRKKRKNS